MQFQLRSQQIDPKTYMEEQRNETSQALPNYEVFLCRILPYYKNIIMVRVWYWCTDRLKEPNRVQKQTHTRMGHNRVKTVKQRRRDGLFSKESGNNLLAIEKKAKLDP